MSDKKFLKVYDNVVPKNIANSLEQFLVHSHQMDYYYTSNLSGMEGDDTKGAGRSFWSIEEPQRRDEEIMFFLSQPLYSLSSYLNFQIFRCIESRVFVQTPSTQNIMKTEGKHVDLNFPHWVCLYYVNDSDGDTVFFNQNDEIIKSVSPKKGRIAFFDGSIVHCTTTPTTYRVVLNFNFIGGNSFFFPKKPIS